MPAPPDVEQRQRNVAVMELLTESFTAYHAGDRAAAGDLADRAAAVDGAAVLVITGGMRIGEVPSPDDDWPGWLEYVDANRQALADLEAAERGPDGGR